MGVLFYYRWGTGDIMKYKVGVVCLLIVGTVYGVWHHHQTTENAATEKTINQSIQIEKKVDSF
jgi:hypothetical protein